MARLRDSVLFILNEFLKIDFTLATCLVGLGRRKRAATTVSSAPSQHTALKGFGT